MSTVVFFDTFNPRYITHWLVATYQLLMGHKFWWVVHVGVRLEDDLDLSTKVARVALVKPETHDRELAWWPLCEEWRKILVLRVQVPYLINCSEVVSVLTTCPYIYKTPARLYQAALWYTENEFLHQARYTNGKQP